MMERALIEYIANTLWQIPLLAGGAWLLLRIVKPRPAFQHGVWLAVLGLSVLLPMHGMVKPEPAGVPLQHGNALPSMALVQYAAISPEHAPETHRIRLGETSTRWLVRLYLATVVFSLFRIVHSWFVARHLVLASREISLGVKNKRMFQSYGQRLSIALPQVRESDEVKSPMILGVAHPVLLLPVNFDRFPASEVRAALCHELAHVKRRDYLGNLLCHLVALPVAWHPFMAVVQQRIRMTREMVCDAMAAREVESPLGYAKSLLALARGLLGGLEIAEHAQFPGLFGNNKLEERVTRLMDTTTMSLRTKLTRVLGGAVVTMATVSAAAIFHVTPTMAQSQPALPSQATQTAAVATQAQPAEPATEPVPQVLPAEQPHIITRKRAPRTAEQAREEQELKQRAEELQQQALRMKGMIDNPEFKRQMEEAQQQALQATNMIDSPEFKRQMEEAKQQALQAKTMIDSPEFKRQIEEAKEQALKAQSMINSPEFKRQMEQAKEQASKATAMIDSPEFKRQIEEAKEQASKARTMINSPEFKRQIEQAQQQALQAQTIIKLQIEDAVRRLAETTRESNDSSEGEQTK
jgi:beta-lactamase regulating signal transducer with metallopeptidase domain